MSLAIAPRRLRLAFIARRFGARFGGAEAYGEYLMDALRESHDVHVFCQEWDSPINVPYTVLPRRRGLPRWLNLIDFTRRCQALTTGFDVVHSHENSWLGDVHVVHVMPVRYARFHHKRSVGRWLATCSSPRWLAYLKLEARRYQAADQRRLVAASSLIAGQIRSAYADTAPCVVITPGVHLPAVVPQQAQSRAQLGLDLGRTYGVLIANDPVRKGLQSLLRALAELPANFHLIVVGGEGGTPGRVRAFADAAGVGQRVHVWPGRRDVGTFYAAADVCIFPTLGDAFGMVPLEAMAYGVPVVLSSAQYCGFAHHVQNGVNAVVLNDPHDAAELARAVRSILEDDEFAAGLRAEAATLAARFQWAAIARQFAALYAEVAAGKTQNLR